jgi:hypothetical protein
MYPSCHSDDDRRIASTSSAAASEDIIVWGPPIRMNWSQSHATIRSFSLTHFPYSYLNIQHDPGWL